MRINSIFKNGNQKSQGSNKIPLLFQNNQSSALVEIGEDTVEQKCFHRSQFEVFYSTLANISIDGVLVTDLEGRITFFSKRMYQILGVPEGEDILQDNIFNWIARESLGLAKTNFGNLIQGVRIPENLEYKFQKHDRSEFWAELSSSLVSDISGKPEGIIVLCRDITYRKKIEEDLRIFKSKAEESDKLKAAFLHNLSHEIRTPLNAIVGFSAMLGEKVLSTDKRDTFIEIIIKSSDKLLAILSDIIEISNIEAGIVRVSEDKIELNEIMTDLFKQFRPYAERKNIILKFSTVIPQDKVIIQSDKAKLVKILSNLLSNSLKFTHSGVISFGYCVKEDVLEFFVSDTGIGIPEDKFQVIFERFYQVQHADNMNHEGTGLGLSISKAYVGLLGGQIWLSSKLCEGTEFHFSLPLIQSQLSTGRRSDSMES